MSRMWAGSVALLVAGIAGCGGGGSTPEPTVVLTACNPVAQTGCSAGKKCTWIRTSSSTSTGALGCAPAGTVDVGGTCQYGADGAMTGYDNCRGGQACLAPMTSAAQGTCEKVCDSSNNLSCTPSSQWACETYSGYFANSGSPASAGLCQAQCNPLTQARLTDGAAACGSPDPANPTRGCYGMPGSGTGQSSVFTCAAAGPSNMTEGVVVSGVVYLNSCAPGYMPLLRQSTGSSNVICSAFCSPSATSLQSHPSPGGLAPDSCQAKGGGATDECRFWWWIEAPGAPVSSWSNGLGFCLNYPNYTYPTGGGNQTYPSCTTLDDTAHNFDSIANDAQFWGCTTM